MIFCNQRTQNTIMASIFRHGSRLDTFVYIQALLLLCSTLAGAQSVPATYVFGDSLADVGNNHYLPFSIVRADIPFNGMDYPGEQATGRFSNGKNAADFIAEKLGLPTAPPYLSQPDGTFVTGVSFASGGAGILNHTGENVFRQDLPMALQLGYFSTAQQRIGKALLSDSAAEQHFSKSLYIVVIGSNDILDYFNNKSGVLNTYSTQQYVDLMASTLKNIIKGIYDLGARKFTVVGVPPVGCTPKQRSKTAGGECNDAMNTMCQSFNAELLQLLPELKSQLTDFHYTYLDTYAVFNKLIQNPAAYGFREIKSACCGLGKLRAEIPCTPISLFCSNRSDHVFWDIYHPTEAAARTFVGIIFSESTEYASPMTIQQLIAA